MVTEAKRGLFRVGSNYARLATTLAYGIAIVPLLAGWLGGDALGLYLFIVSQAGLAAIFHDIVSTSLAREMAAAWHRKDDFRATCDSAMLVCVIVAAIVAMTFGLLWLILPVLNITAGLLPAAQWMVILEGGFTVVYVLVAPAVTMYIAREEFLLQNFFTVLRRSDFIISVLICRVVWPSIDPAQGLIRLMVVAVSIRTAAVLLATVYMWMRDHRVIGMPWRADRRSLRAIRGTFGWNTGVVFANNLHDRSGALLINIWFGLLGNTIFGLANRLVSYVRRVTTGMTFGIEAVGARLAESQDGTSGIKRMLHTVSRSHALVAWPGVVVSFVLADELIGLWLGRTLDDPDQYVPLAALLVRIGVLGLAARAISDGWIFLLYGAGHIRRYAKILFLGGLLNPVLAIALILTLPDLGNEVSPRNNITGVSWAITAVFVLFNGVFLPMRGAKILDVQLRDFLMPLLPPFLLAVAIGPILLLPNWIPALRHDGELWGLLDLTISMGAYGVVYGIAAFFVLLTPDERQRVRRLIPRLWPSKG